MIFVRSELTSIIRNVEGTTRKVRWSWECQFLVLNHIYHP